MSARLWPTWSHVACYNNKIQNGDILVPANPGSFYTYLRLKLQQSTFSDINVHSLSPTINQTWARYLYMIKFLTLVWAECCDCWGMCCNQGPFIRLDAWALTVIATATWLDGWVSVTLRYCIKTAKPIRTLFRPSESPIILVLWDPCADTKFQGEPHQRGR